MELKPLHRKNLIKKLKTLWFNWPYIWGKHEYLQNKNNFKIVIPNTHSGKDIPVPIIKALLNNFESNKKILWIYKSLLKWFFRI
jgi:predicted RNA binding protein YcfA (HicA-like mRNA interferase family)